MAARWWLMFRSLAVQTVLFLAPVLALQQLRPWSYFLSGRGAVAELALEISVLLLLEALCAMFLALILSAGRALRLWGDGADAGCAGLLASFIAIVCGLEFLSPLDAIIGPFAAAGAQTAAALVAIALLTLLGWGQVWAFFNRVNQAAQVVLAICPLLLIPVLIGAFGWRSFDRVAQVSRRASDPSARPNVVLISFDALTAQDMSLYGYQRPTTAQFQRLARRSYNFVNFFSTSDYTTPAVASLLTGQYPLTNRVFQLDGHIPRRMREENLAWVLRRHGYTTAAIVTNPSAHPLTLRLADSFTILPWPPISPWFFAGTFLLQLRDSLLFNAANSLAVYALRDFGCLFSRFNTMSWVDPSAVFASAQQFIRTAQTPFFLWVHLYPPHAPYMPGAGFRGRFLPGSYFATQAQFLWKMPGPYYPPPMQHDVDRLRLRYDESIAECDSALGQFLDWMAASGFAANTVLIVTSDHGENFSGGWCGHESPDLHYAETHVPLLISLPGQDRGYTQAEDGDLTDVAPTILTVLGYEQPAWMEGRPLIHPGKAAPPPTIAYSMYLARSSAFSPPTDGAIAAHSGPYHLVWHFGSGRFELFDVAHDPEGIYNVAVLHPQAAVALVGDIKRRFGGALDLPPVRK